MPDKPAPEKKGQPIDPDLISKVSAIQALTTCFQLLSEGSFHVKHFQAINLAQSFIKDLHDRVIKEALSHPDADQVPELKNIKAQKEARLKELKELEA